MPTNFFVASGEVVDLESDLEEAGCEPEDATDKTVVAGK